MEQLGLKDSFRKIVLICAISYFFILYLILYIGVQMFDVTGCKSFGMDLNRTLGIRKVHYTPQLVTDK